MMTTAHNSISVVRGLTQVVKLVSPGIAPKLESLDLICAGRRTWFYDFVK